MMAGMHHMGQLGFGDAQHFGIQPLATCADSQEECSSPDPEADSSDMEQDPQHTPSDDNALQEMVDIGMPVVLNPEFLMCGTNLHPKPQLTFSSNGFKIEYLDSDSGQDGNLLTLFWEVPDIISIDCNWVQMVQSALITLHGRSSAETVNSGPVKIQFCLADPQWEWKQQKIWQLDSRYQEVWKNIPLDDFASQNWSADTEPSLCFPKQYFNGIDDFDEFTYAKGDREAVAINSKDLKLLLPETFVNDTLIDFYIKYLSTRIESTERCRYHFFNSFFFRKLADLDKDQEKAPKGREAFLCVRKWTRKIDIFAKDFLFIPVNFSLHWSLLVICYPGEVETFDKDGDARIADKVPCIMHLNSIKGTHSGLKNIIQSYLWEEWKERHPESASDSSDKFLNLRFLSLELPQQDNLFDCGLFLLHYVERFLMDAPSFFNPMKIDVYESFLGDDWFVPAEASLKRSVIRKLIYELAIEPSKTYPKLICGGDKHEESHHRSEKAVGELSREYLAQGRCAAEPDSVCRILGAHQQSKLICLNDSEKGLSVPVRNLETEKVSVVAQQDMQVCPSDDDVVVCSPCQDAKNEPSFAHSGNQLDGKSCAPEDAEEFKGIWDQLARPVMVDDMNNDIAECSSQRSTSEAMDPGAVEDDATAEKASTTAGSIDDSEQYVSSESRDGNSGGIMSSDRAVSCGLKDGNVAGGTANGSSETHANGEDACGNLATGEVAPREDDTTCSDAEISHVNGISTCSAKEEASADNGIACQNTRRTDADGHELAVFSCEVGADAKMPPHVDGARCADGHEFAFTDADGHELAVTDADGDAKMHPHVDGTCCSEDVKNSVSDSICKAKMAADKMNGSDQDDASSHDLEDGNTDWAGSDSEQQSNEKHCVGAKRPFPGSSSSVCKAMGERTEGNIGRMYKRRKVAMDKFWQDNSERTERRFGRRYKRRILCNRRKVRLSAMKARLDDRFWLGCRERRFGRWYMRHIVNL